MSTKDFRHPTRVAQYDSSATYYPRELSVDEATRTLYMRTSDGSSNIILSDMETVNTNLAALNKKMSLNLEGSSFNYQVTSAGWKRILVSSRSNSGTVDLAIHVNNINVGRFFQNITFGYSCAVEHPGSKTEEKRASLNSTEPKLWQITNNCFGEDPSQSGLARLFRIDKVRIAYPISWDETDEGDTNERYSNPIYTYLDVHLVGNIPDGLYVNMRANIMGKSQNYGTTTMIEETPVQLSDDGYVLGINGVKCHTKELILWEDGMMNVPNESRFDGLVTEQVDALVEKTLSIADGERINTERVDVKSLEIYVDNDADPVREAPLVLRAAYKENMLPGCSPAGGQYSNKASGVSFKRLGNGVFQLTGTSTAVLCNWIYKYEEGDCPIKLLKGHTYYVWGQQLRLHFDITATSGYTYIMGYDNTTWLPKLVSYTPAMDMYLLRSAFYCDSGITYDGTLIYPQLTEEESLIVGDLNEGGQIYDHYMSYCEDQERKGFTPRSYLHYLRTSVLPENMYSPPAMEIPLNGIFCGVTLFLDSGVATTKCRIAEEDTGNMVETDGPTQSCPLIPLYKPMLAKAAYLYGCWGNESNHYYYSPNTYYMTCTARVPMIKDGSLAEQTGALLKSGGTMTGALTMNGIYLTEGVDYFAELPEYVPNGKLIFVEAGA